MIKINIKNININEILLSGACFRATFENDNSITNILKDRVVNFKQEGDILYIKSSNENNIENVVKEYFDLNRDYESINKELIKRNNSLKDVITKCNGYRILNQDPFEMGISYIISQNNNVKRISKIVNDISRVYGKIIIFEGKTYYLFPTYDDLKDITIEDLKQFKLGFRDKYIIDYIHKYEILNDLDKIDTQNALDILQSVKGIGLKVASCILLFGYRKLDVFPIDTWVKKYMTSKYNIKDDVNTIKKYAQDNFYPYSGLVIQYLFHIERNVK